MRVQIFSPGRTEIGGNHTDHQHGIVLAAAVNLALTGTAELNGENVIRVHSKGYPPDVIDLADLSVRESERGKSAALIRGVCAWFAEHGYKIGGFNAVTESSVPSGSGLSSSACFEVAIGNILAGLFENAVTPVEIALAGQYAESVYFGKPCGLMDQMACSVGGIIQIDFRDPNEPIIEKIDFDFEKAGLALCVTDTGGSHADLTDDYAAIPREMREVANHFGKDFLREVEPQKFYAELPNLKLSHRAILRSIHFFEENERVPKQTAALKDNRIDDFLKLVNQSGRSSFMYLQNVYSNPREQGLSLALAISEKILGGRGAFRVHGGGFAGTIQAFVPLDLLEAYTSEMNRIFPKCLVLSVSKGGRVESSP
ncbi:galactokinase [Clostridia bacterium]|nr:galactokinase [Clostridia bacterium]